MKYEVITQQRLKVEAKGRREARRLVARSYPHIEKFGADEHGRFSVKSLRSTITSVREIK